MGEYICPKCGNAGERAGKYNRCTDCHKNKRRERYHSTYKAVMLPRRRERYRSDPEYRDRIQATTARSRQKKLNERAESRVIDPLDRVYFVREGDDGPIKIGVTQDMETRLRSMQTGNPRTLAVLAMMPGSFIEEAILHDRFAAHRIRGEWFHPAPALLDYIASLTSESLAA